MVSYRIEWKQSARKELKKLAKVAIPKILEAAAALAKNPHPQVAKSYEAASIHTVFE